MLSLRSFHLVFLLFAIVCAELFGAWAIWHYPETRDFLSLVLGISALIGGFALIVYTIWFVRRTEEAHIV
jgi:uncharacterized membrane protein HdeD (DUF308 family)